MKNNPTNKRFSLIYFVFRLTIFTIFHSRFQSIFMLACVILLKRPISNNGLLVRAITDILFYTDLIGTMVEIN